LFQKGVDSTLPGVLEDQTKRDRDDSQRAVAPLKAADDAIKIDSTSMPLSEVVTKLEDVVRKKLSSRG
ncbi:MAG: (d)CMP kinase, partial [Myxococcaceae bacterium]